ncbi:MFS transporter [Dokdonia sinensis]|uniref:MFS transporter n=1 Tax=Dokdonia sinensis TaxID=2479847 RepID=A0A3M0FVY8_9FLAO|nr:MFS transporter [Dokdonia sinensis]RMB56638.1 MFS transporter [Dokdonia sinensis]
MHSLVLILANKRYFAPSWVFASLNIMIGTWVLYIPRVKDALGLDDGEIGIALFCLGLGTLTSLTFASRVIKSLGVGKSTIVGISIFALLYIFPLLAPSYLLLCIALFLVGIFSCFTDIAMNALVSDLETEDEVHFMSSAHGFFSIGGAIAAGVGYFIIDHIEVPVYHIMGAAVVVLITNAFLAKNYIHIKAPVEENEGKVNLGLLKPLLGLTIIAFIIMGSEGAIEQWSKLYLEDVVQVTSEKTAGMGFLMFSLFMALGRFFGDGVSKRFGALKIIIGGSTLALLGYMLVLTAITYTAIIGFAIIGLGFSVVIPELLRLAGKVKGVSSADGISFVAGAGFIGFLGSPPLVGFLADMSSLKLSFMVLAVGSMIATLVGLVKMKNS